MIGLVAVISSPKYLEDIDRAVEQLCKEVVFKKIDRDIDILEEKNIIDKINMDMLILDISCVEDPRKLPQFIRGIQMNKESIRIIIIAPYSFSGNLIMNDLISMGIYNIIGQEDQADSHILSSIIELYENPSTYAKAIKWDKGAINRNKREQEFIKTGEGRFGKKKTSNVITVEKDKIVGTIVIAVAGTISRIGTTHTAISIGNFLLRNKNGVAVVEMQQSDAFESIKNSYDNVELKKGFFSLAGIDFYPYDPAFAVSDLILGDYDYVVLDMGPYDICDVAEFKRAQERIIVSGVKDWELDELDKFLKTESKKNANKYLFSFCGDNMFQFVKGSMEPLYCYQAAYNPQPFDDNEEANEVYEKILCNVLPRIKEQEKGLLDSLLKKKEIIPHHKPILLKRVEIKTTEKEEFLKYMIVILLIVILLVVFGFLVVTSPSFSGIKNFFSQLVKH